MIEITLITRLYIYCCALDKTFLIADSSYVLRLCTINLSPFAYYRCSRIRIFRIRSRNLSHALTVSNGIKLECVRGILNSSRQSRYRRTRTPPRLRTARARSKRKTTTTSEEWRSFDLLVRQQKLIAVRIHAFSLDAESIGLDEDRLPYTGLEPHAFPSGWEFAAFCKKKKKKENNDEKNTI